MRCFARGSLWSVYLLQYTTSARSLSGYRPTCLRRLSTTSQTVPPILSVLPCRALVDEKFKVVVENLPPGAPVTLHSLHHSEDKDYWEAFGHYISDHRGTVCVAEDLSFGGLYTGKEPMGLLWSMRPVPGSRKGLRLRNRDVCSPMLVNVSVYSGHVAEGFMELAPLASVLTERWYMAPGVQRIDIREKGVRGTLFIPTGPGPFPGLLDIWGGGGGLMEYRSALLASRGYTSLVLEYYNPSEQKSAEEQLHHFETAFGILKNHPQVIPDKVGLFGLSLGTTASIYLAAESTVVKPRCCVCVSGSHAYLQGGPFRGVLELILKNFHMKRVDENNYIIFRDIGLGIASDAAKKVDVGKINCPMLFINGEDDQCWPTVECTEETAQMMQEAGKEHLLSRVQYPNAGHLIEPPYSPHFRAATHVMDTTKEKVIMLWGGQTKPHSDAQEDAWRKILTFLQHHLYCSPTLKDKMIM